MHRVTARLRARGADDGVTLIELVVCVAIVGVIVVSLTGVVMAYLKTSISTAARMTESHDVQFAAAYWQRDVASIGVRSTTYDHADTVHSYPLEQSVGVTPGCAGSLPAGTRVVTLAWSSYDVADPDHPTTVTVTYVAVAHGVGTALRYELLRVHCTGASRDSTLTVADNLLTVPTTSCPTACTGTGHNVPTEVSMALVANDPDGHNADYTATLSGERRQT
ncbi:MAG: type II secretion system protein [Nocardioides sp.]